MSAPFQGVGFTLILPIYLIPEDFLETSRVSLKSKLP